MKKIAIFASGTGSNALKIIEHFAGIADAQIAFIISNNPAAPVLDIAKNHHISSIIINRTGFYKTEDILERLLGERIDFIVLAGFMWLVPAYLVAAFPGRIINIHPALLPKFGGKGMYGMNVHEAVYAAKETETGITIHYVNEHYDEGSIIFQAKCSLEPTDTPDLIALKIRTLEHQNFPLVVEKLVEEL